MRKISRRLFLLVFLSACSSLRPRIGKSTLTPLPTMAPLATARDQSTYTLPSPPMDEPGLPEATPLPINVVISESNENCITPIIAPTSAPIPPAGGVDQTTGRNVMGIVQVLDHQTYRLAVTGLVDHPLNLTFDDLRCMPKMTEKVTTTCYDFQATATWSGVLIKEILKEAGVQPGAKNMILNGADFASRTVPLDMAMDGHNFLAYEMGGQPIPILFGFPVRAIFINVAGQYSVKWLTSLEVI